MEKLVCQKQGHEMPLDMICLNKTCNNKGLLCHKCFINIPHHHMSSEIVHAHKFIENCQTALDQAYEKISHLDDREEEGIREENNASKTMIEECRKKAENVTIQLFEGLDKEITSKFEELFNEIEGPKKVVLTDIDKFRTSLKEVQSGLIDDPIDMNKDILSVWQVLEKSKENGFILKENCSNKNALIQKEEKVNLFKKDSDRIKFVLDRMQEWIKGKPDLKELNQNKPKAKVTPKLLDKPIQKSTEKSVEALRKENEMASSLAGKKRLNHLDKDEGSKGENPYKKVKSSIMNPLHGEDSKLRRTITPARLESKDLNSHISSFAQPQRRDFEQGLMFKKQEEEKIPKEEVAKKTISRFTPDDKGYENFRYLHTHAITFKADRDLTMFGFGHYMVFRPTVMAMMEYTLFEGDCADQDDYSTSPPKVLSTGPFQLSKSQGNLKVMEVRLKAPVKIVKNQFYTLKVVNKTKNIDFHCFKGVNGIEKCPPFTFFPSRSSDMAQIYTSVKRGQIPEIIYSMEK